MQRAVRPVFVVLALALVAACSGGGADPAPDSAAGDVPEGGERTTTAAPDQTAEEPAEGEALTLESLMGWGGDNAEALARERERRIQEDIRLCMAEQGFDYIPLIAPDDAYTVLQEADAGELVRSQGFGITTWFGNEEAIDGGSEWVDPNEDSVAAMSESEQQAWNDALYGSAQDLPGSVPVEEVDEETGGSRYGDGCSGKALEAAYGGAELDALWEELGPAFEELHERVQADPRIVQANADWLACMATAGYGGLSSRDEMIDAVYEDFQQRFDAIVGEFSDPMAGWSEDEVETFLDEKTDEEVDAFFEAAQREALESVDKEALAALQQEEIDMAVADWECGQGLNDLRIEVSAEYEADLIAENRAVLDQIRDVQGG